MTAAPAKKVRQMPKGGRKGGSVFPRVALADAVAYAKKLVSKTHTGPQTRDVILMGVMGSKHDRGEIGMSALKQFGFMTGDTKSNFSADDLAKKVVSSPPQELTPFLRQAALKPKVFKALFDTYHSDTVSKAKLKQRAADLNVHPEETGKCVELYVASMVTASLATVSGDQVTHVASADATALPGDGEIDAPVQEGVDAAADEESRPADVDDQVDGSPEVNGKPAAGDALDREYPMTPRALGPRAVFNVNVTLDSSLDIEKLQKQLELLKRFGAL